MYYKVVKELSSSKIPSQFSIGQVITDYDLNSIVSKYNCYFYEIHSNIKNKNISIFSTDIFGTKNQLYYIESLKL